MDDCGNHYSRVASILAQSDAHTVVLQCNWDAEAWRKANPSDQVFDWEMEASMVEPGEPVLIVDPDTGEPAYFGLVSEVHPYTWNGRKVTAVKVDKPLPALKTRELEDEPFVVAPGQFLNHDDSHPVEHFFMAIARKSDGFVIRDSHMGRNTVTAWKVKASNGLIANNTFTTHGWRCLNLCGEFQWQEGFSPRHIPSIKLIQSR